MVNGQVKRSIPEELVDDLKERGESYGKFLTQAELSQRLKAICHAALEVNPAYLALPQFVKHVIREGLDMILSKIARLCNGDPLHRDSWKDIAGYAAIISRDTETK